MRALFGVVLSVAVVGCASITDGTEQTIVVSLTPKEARCVASRSDVELGTLTGASPTLTVSKGARDILITCKARGYDDKIHRLVSSTQTAGVVGGIFLDLGITDMITGAMWKYPSNVSIALDPSTPVTSATVPTPTPAPTATQTPMAVPVSTTAAPTSVLAPKSADGAIGQDSIQVERMAKGDACHSEPKGLLTAKGAGFEVYSVTCRDGNVMMFRCEFGNCRVLK